MQLAKGYYSGYGQENLQRLYDRRIEQNKQGNNANKRQRPENGKEEGNSGDESQIRDSIGELFSKHDGGRRRIRKTNEQPIGLKALNNKILSATHPLLGLFPFIYHIFAITNFTTFPIFARS